MGKIFFWEINYKIIIFVAKNKNLIIMSSYLDQKNDLTNDYLKIDLISERSMLDDAEKRRIKKRNKRRAKKTRIIAQKLLNKGMSIEDVGDATGLTIQQIEEILNKGSINHKNKNNA